MITVKLKDKLSLKRLKEVMRYDPKTGLFYWVSHPRIKPGTIAGSLYPPEGYRYLKIDGTVYRACRVVWFYTYGVWPTGVIDHKDRNAGNDKLTNLRDTTVSKNALNAELRLNTETMFRGVRYVSKTDKFEARVCIKGNRKSLGYFKTVLEAAKVREEYINKHLNEETS